MFSKSDYPTEMKLAVLYLLSQSSVKLTADQILTCMIEQEIMGYFDTMESLGQLADTNLVYVHHDKDMPVTYSSSIEGKMLLGEFKSQIPASVRDIIREYVQKNLLKLRRENEHPADYISLPDGKYVSTLKARDDDDELIISLTSSSKEAAEGICARWRDNAGDIYAFLVTKLLADD